MGWGCGLGVLAIVAALVWIGVLADGHRKSSARQLSAPLTVETAPTSVDAEGPGTISCTFRDTYADGTSVIVRVEHLSGWVDKDPLQPLNCRNYRAMYQARVAPPGTDVAFAEPRNSAPTCVSSVNGVPFEIWQVSDPASAQAVCAQLDHLP